MTEKHLEYFIRHTDILELDHSQIDALFEDRRFGFHFESNFEDKNDYLDEKKYSTSQGRTAIRYLLDISKNGGYIWAEYSLIKKIMIGYVEPNTKIDIISLDPNKTLNNKDGKLILKTLKFSKFQEIEARELLMLKARRPRQGTFVRWRNCFGKLTKIVENGISEEIKEWTDLTPDLQEIVSYEYLRDKGINGWKIKHLLMPIGRTMKDIDIYALNTKNEPVFVQVTHLGDDKTKLQSFAQYKSNLIYISSNPKLSNQNSEISVLNSAEIFRWLLNQHDYMKQLAN